MGKWWWFSAVMKFNLRLVVVVALPLFHVTRTTAPPMMPLNRFYFVHFHLADEWCEANGMNSVLFFPYWSKKHLPIWLTKWWTPTTTDTNCWAIYQLLKINGKRRAIHWNRTNTHATRNHKHKKERHDASAYRCEIHSWCPFFRQSSNVNMRRRGWLNRKNVTANNKYRRRFLFITTHNHSIMCICEGNREGCIIMVRLLVSWLCFLLTQY